MSEISSDKGQEYLMDAEAKGVMSDCCSAAVYNEICADCKEHCGTVSESESEEGE